MSAVLSVSYLRSTCIVEDRINLQPLVSYCLSAPPQTIALIYQRKPRQKTHASFKTPAKLLDVLSRYSAFQHSCWTIRILLVLPARRDKTPPTSLLVLLHSCRTSPLLQTSLSDSLQECSPVFIACSLRHCHCQCLFKAHSTYFISVRCSHIHHGRKFLSSTTVEGFIPSTQLQIRKEEGFTWPHHLQEAQNAC
jgi:hypothetical protein